ncbi:hypothetical protein SR870_12375 [Rhodopseudomonas palustris]|uniref:hypothetical protein n=1 Tax=Rhodopseudomonas palustris TaxID=1076 RepID=UPI002ACDCD39|nr:hypothetical protein [Rhodopseudomonas palustris]WQG97517.1 hypothetical protein SR870_12375 [Rhodopseudomonas palustris]
MTHLKTLTAAPLGLSEFRDPITADGSIHHVAADPGPSPIGSRNRLVSRRCEGDCQCRMWGDTFVRSENQMLEKHGTPNAPGRYRRRRRARQRAEAGAMTN